MRKSNFRKGMVFGILVLFFGASVTSSTVGTIEKKITFIDSISPGYIQDLIDNASAGDTIYIPSGTYYENIIINKSISLVGEDKDTTVIDGSEDGDVIHISADWVNISGFTIKNGHQGIWFLSSNSTIINNSVTHNEYGIYLRYSRNNTLIGNYIASNNHDGITLYNYSNNNYITDNIMSHNMWGIYLSFSCNNTITRNTITSNDNAGMRITDSSKNNLITVNNFSSNFTNHGHIELLSSSFNTIKHNNFIRKLGWQVTFGYHWSKDNMCNYWNENYWNRPRIFPKPIIGFILFDTEIGSVLIPWVTFDWNPAKEPYKIEV